MTPVSDTGSIKSRVQHQLAADTAGGYRAGSYDVSRSLQIIGRGNDQVAISSKFETREDIGMRLVGVARVAHGRGGVSAGPVVLQ